MRENQDCKNYCAYEAPRIFVTALQDELPLLADSPDVKPDVDIVDPIEIDGGELGAD